MPVTNQLVDKTPVRVAWAVPQDYDGTVGFAKVGRVTHRLPTGRPPPGVRDCSDHGCHHEAPSRRVLKTNLAGFAVGKHPGLKLVASGEPLCTGFSIPS